MYCRVCGVRENVEYRPSKLQTLCDPCSKETPRKIGREEFDAAYWKGEGADTVPESTKREFYSDYKTSTHTLEEYIEATTRQA